MPDHVLRTLADSQVEDIHLVARRGPAQAAFTTKELRELGELANADVLVDPAQLVLDEASAAVAAGSRAVARNVEVLREWSRRPLSGKKKRIHLHFHLRPVSLEGQRRVARATFEPTRLDSQSKLVGTGERLSLDVQMVIRAVGYRGIPLPGIPFNCDLNAIPNASGRVLRDDAISDGEYVSGWIRRGAKGILGANKLDATETVQAILDDVTRLMGGKVVAPEGLESLIKRRGLYTTGFEDWLAVDRAEISLGNMRGCDRVILHSRAELLRAGCSPNPS